jgi:hypothetical protein
LACRLELTLSGVDKLIGENSDRIAGEWEAGWFASNNFFCSERILSTNFEQQTLQFKSGDSTPEYLGWRRQTTLAAAMDMSFNSRLFI